jgi:hypothetical protein
MRCSTKQHQLSCGLDLHARTMSRCIVHQEGERLLPRPMPAGPAPCRQAVAPSRTARVVGVACRFPWYGLAALWARAGIAGVRGPARAMTAMHGGTAPHAPLDAPQMAVVLRGEMLPQASGSPAARRATRELLRRRMPLLRTRAELLAPRQQTNSP